jgi:DNA invertase Pin-like site-specific DNA recombinase
MKVDWNLILKLNRNNRYPQGAGYKTGGASQEAAEKINRKLKKVQQQVYDAMKAYFPNGASPDMLADKTGIDRQTVASRFTELTSYGYLVKTDRRAKTLKGQSCHIWQLNACNSTQNKDN